MVESCHICGEREDSAPGGLNVDGECSPCSRGLTCEFCGMPKTARARQCRACYHALQRKAA